MKWLRGVAITAVLVVAGTATDDAVIRQAEAVVGRPGTPGSVAGVARRTTRRMIRRTAIYAPALPAGCQTVVIEGTTLQQCGGTYYQASGSQYEVVEVD
jgi:hypothetical protein